MADLPRWLSGEAGAWRIALWVQPGASRTQAAGEQDGCLKLRIAARPVEGAANEALVDWFAQRLGCPRRALSLLRGEQGRRKLLAVALPMPAEELVARLG